MSRAGVAARAVLLTVVQVQRRRYTAKECRDLEQVDCFGRQQLAQVSLGRHLWSDPFVLIPSLQLRILERAMQLLAPGGRLVYSTCSFNPVENEAVIAAALNNQGGQFGLVDVSADFPELKRRPGLTSWKVATQPNGKEADLVWHDSYDAYREKADAGLERERDRDKGIPSTIWPPANASELGLEKA